MSVKYFRSLREEEKNCTDIGIFPGVDDSLGDYLESLGKSEKYDVELALPGHRQTGNYQDRLKELKNHHANRLNEVKGLIEEYPLSTTYEIASRMKWRIKAESWEEFPTTQKWFAMGEALSHVRHLVKLSAIERIEREDGKFVYRKKT